MGGGFRKKYRSFFPAISIILKISNTSKFFKLSRFRIFEISLRALTIVNFCNSVRPVISASKNMKIATKKINEEEIEDFCKEEYFNFQLSAFKVLTLE